MSIWRTWFGPPDGAGAPVNFAGATDVGCKRKQNQDGWAVGPTSKQDEVRSKKSGALPLPGWIAVAEVSYQPPPQHRILAVTERNSMNVAPQRLTNVVS